MGAEWVPAAVGIVFFLTVGGVILLRPITKRLGEYLEVLIREKREEPRVEGQEQLRHSLEGLEDRLSLVEEKLEFTERLLASSGREEKHASDEGDRETA